MITKARSAGAVAAALTLLLGACSVSGAGSPQPEVSTESPIASASSALPQVAFGKTHRYADGLTLRVSQITEAKLGPFPTTEDPLAKEGDPYFILTLTWDNRSNAEVEISPSATVLIGTDGRPAARVYAGEDRDQLNMSAGETDQYEVACLIPETDRGQVVLDITDAQDPARSVAFTGSID